MRKIFTLSFLLISLFAFSKKPNGDKELALGKQMYKLEKASWYSTDHFLATYPDKIDSIGGYLSYLGENDYVYSIFFSRNDNYSILARYKFENTPNSVPVSVDTENTIAFENERNLIAIRQDAYKKLVESSDNFFQYYENTSYNFIPIISKSERAVYILTAPRENGYVLIGNDYKLSYNKKNEMVKKKKLHNSLITLPYSDSESEITTTMHSHVISDIIDPTDICTLLLYKEFVDWNQHIVISKDYVSIFEMDKETLLILTRKVWDKMYKK